MMSPESRVSQNMSRSYKRELITDSFRDTKLRQIFGIAEGHINGRKQEFTSSILNAISRPDVKTIWDAERVAFAEPEIGDRVIGALWEKTQVITRGPFEDATHRN